ncbi:hypothetical protein, partial [Staphylococcus pseudintermedius]|uniref:hypothetical protein n=1 Tax=Staphylococcus pseudintermedius TaxID=283734 RepID=UPI0036F26D04
MASRRGPVRRDQELVVVPTHGADMNKPEPQTFYTWQEIEEYLASQGHIGELRDCLRGPRESHYPDRTLVELDEGLDPAYIGP